MRRHLNTLYVTTENAWLHKDGENIVVKVEGSERARVPIHILGSVVCMGTLGATPALLGHCARNGVCVRRAPPKCGASRGVAPRGTCVPSRRPKPLRMLVG